MRHSYISSIGAMAVLLIAALLPQIVIGRPTSLVPSSSSLERRSEFNSVSPLAEVIVPLNQQAGLSVLSKRAADCDACAVCQETDKTDPVSRAGGAAKCEHSICKGCFDFAQSKGFKVPPEQGCTDCENTQSERAGTAGNQQSQQQHQNTGTDDQPAVPPSTGRQQQTQGRHESPPPASSHEETDEEMAWRLQKEEMQDDHGASTPPRAHSPPPTSGGRGGTSQGEPSSSRTQPRPQRPESPDLSGIDISGIDLNAQRQALQSYGDDHYDAQLRQAMENSLADMPPGQSSDPSSRTRRTRSSRNTGVQGWTRPSRSQRTRPPAPRR